jgi:hypothetical protein
VKRSLGLLLVLSAAVFALADDKKDKDKKEEKSAITVLKDKRTIIVPAKVAPRKIDDEKLKEAYKDEKFKDGFPIEVIATFPYPRGAKAHETVVTFDCKPSDVHKALVDFGLKPGKPAKALKEKQTGPEVRIYLEHPPGKGKRVPIEQFLVDKKTNKPMPKIKWLFTGSEMIKVDPQKPEVYGADEKGTLIAVFPVTAETVFQSDRPLEEEKYVKLEVSDKLPKVGTSVNLVIVAPEVRQK